METIKKEKEETEQENLEIKEWTEENNDKIENICNLYYKLKKSLGWGTWERDGIIT